MHSLKAFLYVYLVFSMNPRESRRQFIGRSAKLTALQILPPPDPRYPDEARRDLAKENEDPLHLQLPFRSRERAIAAYEKKRIETPLPSEEKRQPTPLERILQHTKLSDHSHWGIVNGHIWHPTENQDLAHNLIFALNPLQGYIDNGREKVPLFSNTKNILNFRAGSVDENHIELFDQVAWAASQGHRLVGVVELDNDFSPEKMEYFTRILAYADVKDVIIGNEPNIPEAKWRDSPQRILSVCKAVKETYLGLKLFDATVSLPALAYYGNGEYLKKLLDFVKQSGEKYMIKNQFGIKTIPLDAVADHYYGPVHDYKQADTTKGFLSRIDQMKKIINESGFKGLKYIISEIGNPAKDVYKDTISDHQLAEGYIPQMVGLGTWAARSGKVDKMYYYSLIDGAHPEHSLGIINDGKLTAKDSYKAFAIAVKLYSRLTFLDKVEDNHLVRLIVKRWDGIEFETMWSKQDQKNQIYDVPGGYKVYDALGEEVKPESKRTIQLAPREKGYLAGAPQILVRTA